MVKTIFHKVAGSLICITLLFAGCSSTPEPEPVQEQEQEKTPSVAEKKEKPPKKKAPPVKEKPDIPDWAREVPVEDGVIFGIAVDSDEEKVNNESLADMAWQMAAQSYRVILEDFNTSSALKEELAIALGEQMVKAVLLNSEIADTYISSNGEIWVLSRKKTDWVLDVLESILIFHSSKLDLSIDAKALVSEVERNLAVGRVDNPGIESPDDIPGLLGDIAGGRKSLPTKVTL